MLQRAKQLLREARMLDVPDGQDICQLRKLLGEQMYATVHEVLSLCNM